jgi:transposase
VKLANAAVDKARRWTWNEERRLRPPPPPPKGRPRKDAAPRPRNEVRFVKHTRWALLKDPDNLLESQLAVLDELRRTRSVLYRCWQLKEGIRDLYRLHDPADAAYHLDWWLAWACRCRIPAFVTLSKTVRTNRDRILAAIELGLSNECASHCASL